MKKIIVLMLVVALCATVFTSCELLEQFMPGDDNTPVETPDDNNNNNNDNNNDNNDNNNNEPEKSPLDDVAAMYRMSAPTKVVATTKQAFGSYELNCSYEIVTGYIDNSQASVYTVTTEELRTVEEGGNTEEVKDMIKSTTKKTEAIEGFGSRTNGGEWNPNGEVWSIGRGGMALNLDNSAVTNVVYENHTLTFTVSAENAATVLGAAYAKSLAGDVSVKIVDDGAVVTYVELHYSLVGDGANLGQSEMTVKVTYTYDLERITIE